jgi:hypothetical protein
MKAICFVALLGLYGCGDGGVEPGGTQSPPLPPPPVVKPVPPPINITIPLPPGRCVAPVAHCG